MSIIALRQVNERQNWCFGYIIDESSLNLLCPPSSTKLNSDDASFLNLHEEIHESASLQQHALQRQDAEPLVPQAISPKESKQSADRTYIKKSKNARGRKYRKESSEDEEQSFITKPRRHHPIKKASPPKPKKPYPTKNFLPAFRGCFLNYLRKYFKAEVFDKLTIIKKIRNKKGINIDDYQQLLNEPLFRPYLKIYFRDKVIYRDLMHSGIGAETKAIYFKKVDVFERPSRIRSLRRSTEPVS